MAKGVYERTEVVKRKMNLAAAKNRVVRFQSKAFEAQQDVAKLTLEVERLEQEAKESRPGDYSEAASNRKDIKMNQ